MVIVIKASSLAWRHSRFLPRGARFFRGSLQSGGGGWRVDVVRAGRQSYSRQSRILEEGEHL